MACEAMNSWTFPEIVAAFVDLSIAYCFLCASTFFFLASKLLALFGLCLPCPCEGLFWNPRNNNTSQCLQRHLSDFSYEKISAVNSAVRSKSPFGQTLRRESDRVTENNIGESGSGPVVFSAEKSESRKPRSGFRRRRNGGLVGSGKISSVRSYDTLRSDAQNGPPRSPPSVSNKRNACSEDDFFSFETETFPNRIEEDDRSALYAELEKERSAAASAADEAMAMISRLQEEKASVEMEARQYQRMIEAKAAYDAEEMDILKEILLRREKEKHFLENEVEAYRQMFSAVDQEDDTPIVVKGSLDYEVTTSVKTLSRTLAFDNELEIPELDDPVSKPLEIGGPVSPDRSMELSADTDRDPPESRVYDVHIIGAEPRKRYGSSSFNDLTSSEGFPLPPLGRGKQIRSDDLRRNASMSAVDYERVRLDGEVEWLTERLKKVQKGRENLKFSAGNGEREKLQLQLLEDIAGQLREIRRLGDPGNVDRQASLPPSYSKVPSKRRRWRSGSLNINQST